MGKVSVALHDICKACYEGNHKVCTNNLGQTSLCYCQLCEMKKEHDD